MKTPWWFHFKAMTMAFEGNDFGYLQEIFCKNSCVDYMHSLKLVWFELNIFIAQDIPTICTHKPFTSLSTSCTHPIIVELCAGDRK